VPVSYLLNDAYPDLHLYALYSFWASFILLEFLLLQGTIYWYVKLGRLRNGKNPATPTRVVQQLRYLRTVDMVLIVTAMVAFAFDIAKWHPSLPSGGLAIAFFIYIFAILEFINYFYFQLSYKVSEIKDLMKNRKLKVSCMNKDFRRIHNWNSEN